jgi:hypothetical protein
VNASEDPVVRSARREAIVVAVTWACALAYTVGYCAKYGYGRSIQDLKFVLGFPDWVFWGIVAPWSVCFVVSWWFTYFFVSDADLGEEWDETGTGTAGTGSSGDSGQGGAAHA